MIKYSRLKSGDAETVKGLLRDYPYREFQQRRQGIDPALLAEMLWNNIDAGLKANKENYLLAQDGNQAIGLAGLSHNSWHSEIYQQKMGTINPLLTYRSDAKTRQKLFADILQLAKKQKFDHLACRIDASDNSAIHDAEKFGFRLVDGSVKLTRKLSLADIPEYFAPTGISLEGYSTGEENILAKIAETSHATNHMFNDPTLPNTASKLLFSKWVKRCCSGLARNIFVVRKNNKPIGFVSYLGADKLEKCLGIKLIVLDFIVIDQKQQGQGLGKWLLSEALRRIEDQYDWVELRTSFNNYPALSLYNRFGFESIAADYLFHLNISIEL